MVFSDLFCCECPFGPELLRDLGRDRRAEVVKSAISIEEGESQMHRCRLDKGICRIKMLVDFP